MFRCLRLRGVLPERCAVAVEPGVGWFPSFEWGETVGRERCSRWMNGWMDGWREIFRSYLRDPGYAKSIPRGGVEKSRDVRGVRIAGLCWSSPVKKR